jgi:3-phenylpropionate/trans-cinnamate dioxygenase ferredoxin component
LRSFSISSFLRKWIFPLIITIIGLRIQAENRKGISYIMELSIEKGDAEMTSMADMVQVTTTDQIPAGTMKSFDVKGTRIMIANVDGKFYAIANTCTHRGGDLSQGKLEGTTVTCPRHGSRFDVTTGKNLSGPKIGLLHLKTADEPAYKVMIEGTSIKIML